VAPYDLRAKSDGGCHHRFRPEERNCGGLPGWTQGWRDPNNPSKFVGRECERETRTPGKTATYGVSVPKTWIRWIRFSVEVFDHLLDSGYGLLANDPDLGTAVPLDPGQFHVAECYPTSTWRSAGLAPMPGHHISSDCIEQYLRNLQRRFALPDPTGVGGHSKGFSHDDVQALVSALPAAALAGGPCKTVPRGLPAKTITADGLPPHRVEGLIWDAVPTLVPKLDISGQSAPTPVPRRQSVLFGRVSASFMPGESGIQRGIRLFRYLAETVNRGDPVGVSYGQFLAFVNGCDDFRQLAGRNYLPSDSDTAIQNAWEITDRAGGRLFVRRGSLEIPAGMDSFIWSSKPPFDRPTGTWTSAGSRVPYSREAWAFFQRPNGDSSRQQS
jgi:hypothetical protein